jgi:hypothetical protein
MSRADDPGARSPAEQPVSQVSQDAKNKVSENRISFSSGSAPSQEHAVSAGTHPSGSINQNGHRRDPPRNQHRLLVRSNRCISMWNSVSVHHSADYNYLNTHLCSEANNRFGPRLLDLYVPSDGGQVVEKRTNLAPRPLRRSPQAK